MKSYRCLNATCEHVFDQGQALGRLVSIAEPATEWDRSPVPRVRLSCPKCASEQMETFHACAECQVNAVADGDDLCAPCRELETEQELQFWLDHRDGPDIWRPMYELV